MSQESTRRTFLAAATAAQNLHSLNVELEHLMWAFCDDPETVLIINGITVNPLAAYSIRNSIHKMFDVMPRTNEEPARHDSMTIKAVIAAATLIATMEGKSLDLAYVFEAALVQPNQPCIELFTNRGITRQAVREWRNKQQGQPKPSYEQPEPDDDATPTPTEEPQALTKYAVNLVARAAEGKLDHLIGRQQELTRAIHVLARRRKNNPIFVGEPGVGKTAIVEGLAQAIHDGKVPGCLKSARIYSLNMGSLVAGTKFRGDFEARVDGVVKAITSLPNAILFIDEIHTIVGGGAAEGSMDAANLLKPALASGQLRCMGSTTFREYQKSIERDKALARRFQKIDVSEPTLEETVKILEGTKKAYQEHHGVVYSSAMIRLIAELANKHITDRFMPDKALDAMDEVGAAVKLATKRKSKTVKAKDVESVVARIARIPEKSVSVNEKTNLATMDVELGKVIFGQDAAIEALTSAVRVSRSGLGHPHHSAGAFLFAGPTGTGKTELVKQLALLLGVNLIRFDMSEYMESHSVSKLLGSPPGYIGFSDGALLVDAIIKHPHSVLVLDEIEKAHPSVFNVLLQVMDNATLTDSQGRVADFRNVIIVMTTNAGSFEMSTRSLGFGKTTQASSGNKALEQLFAPEFRNRLDSTVVFSFLGPEVVGRIVDKCIGELNEQLKANHTKVELNDDARNWFMANGYDRKFGARPMTRLLDRTLRRPIASELLFGSLQSGGIVKVEVANNELKLNYEVEAVVK